MIKFSIVDTGCRKQDIKFLVTELRKNNLIVATEKDEHGDAVYHTHNITTVKKIADEYDGLMVDIVKY